MSCLDNLTLKIFLIIESPIMVVVGALSLKGELWIIDKEKTLDLQDADTSGTTRFDKQPKCIH